MDRKKVIAQLNKFIKNESLSKQVEESINKWTDEYLESNMAPPFMKENFYNDKLSDVLKNLDTKYNSYLLDAIKTKMVQADKIAFLKPEEMHPEKFDDLTKKRKINQALKDNKETTDAFKCPKCKNRESWVEQKQTRAGDEPMTTFVTCVKCKHVQKF